MVNISLEVNGKLFEVSVDENLRLIDLLRDELGLTGTKEGCGEGECGACTILLDGKPVNSCLVLAVDADGRDILTIEGLSNGTELDNLQASFITHGALQCGYCTPGMVMAAKGLLAENPHPTEEEVKEAISGNLCRCTGYKKIIEAIMDVAER